jgi:hypothetical protein
MAFAKPSVQITQVFTQSASEPAEPLRACIVGPNAILHRYTDSTEKETIYVGQYDHTAEICYPWPNRSAGGVVDAEYVRVFIDNALLLYFEDLADNNTNGRGTVAPVSGYTNRVASSAVNFRSNGASFPRSALLFDRDAAIGDRVYIRGVEDPLGDCIVHELWTSIAGFVTSTTNDVINAATVDAGNATSQPAAADIDQTAGAENCVTAVVDGSTDYDGLAAGYPCETYTIEVVQSSIAGCGAARLRVTSASGTDNVDEVTPAAFGAPTAIGTRGLYVTFDVDTGLCSSSASAAEAAPDDFVIGQTWEVEICQAFEEVCAISGGDYSGAQDDTYVIEVTKGGVWADGPEITVTTIKGLDFSGPTPIAAPGSPGSPTPAVTIGSQGVTIRFDDCGGPAIAGLCKGDKFYISCLTGANGPVRTLVLRHDLPDGLAGVSDLDLRLYIQKDIEVTENRLSDPPNVNYTLEATQLCLNPGITAYDPTWTNNGVELALPVHGGASEASKIYIHYREWSDDLVDQVNFASSIADLDDIPGQLDEDNPLKWGVYRALQNSNSARVAYVAVPDNTDSLDDYQTAIARVDGRDDMYNFVPLTYSREVINLFQAHVEAESGPERSNWKAVVCALQGKTTKLLVGKSSAAAQELQPTSSNGELVLAKLVDNPNATGIQYTRLTVPAANSNFITYGVRSGDIVRFLYSIDGFGDETYTEFIVDSVLSENSLLLQAGHASAINVAQKVEIWRNLSRSEVKADLIDQAQGYGNRRVVAIWPDRPATAGNVQAGYFLAAAIAGLASGVLSNQGLTNVEVNGFDNLTSYTTDYFTDAQLTEMSNGGVWIVTEDRNGTPITRHAVTTDTSDLKVREEMIRRNLDAISYVFVNALRPYIGRANATPVLLERLNYILTSNIGSLSAPVATDLGPRLISGEIVTLRIHPLAADRIEIVLNLVLPAPLNEVQLYLVV